MREIIYLAVFEPSGKKGYSVYFPDVLGCVSYGKNYKHALKMAAESLGSHIAWMEVDGDKVPEPTRDPNKLGIEPDLVPQENDLVVPVSIYPDMYKPQWEKWAMKKNSKQSQRGFSYTLQSSIKRIFNL